MRLVLFRSLIGSSKEQRQRGLLERIHTIHNDNHNPHQNNPDESSSPSFQKLDGVELSLSQLRMTSDDVVHSCAEQQLRILCRIHPTSVRDVGKQLDQLSNVLSSASSPSSSSSTLDLVSMHHHFAHHNPTTTTSTTSFETITSYLYQVLPLAAQFLESYPHVGNSHGQQNAHGQPLDTHVMGISHTFVGLPWSSSFSRGGGGILLQPHSPSISNDLQFLSDIVDILPPTRLSLHAAQITHMYPHPRTTTTTTTTTHEPLDTTSSHEDEKIEMFQSIMEHTDHIYLDNSVEPEEIRTAFATTRNKKKPNRMADALESYTIPKESNHRTAPSPFDSSSTLGLNQLWDWQQHVLGSNETYATITSSSCESPPHLV